MTNNIVHNAIKSIKSIESIESSLSKLDILYPEDNCTTHNDIIVISSRENKGKMWNIINLVHKKCTNHICPIIILLIEKGPDYNDLLVKFYEGLGDNKHLYFGYIIFDAVMNCRYDLFDLFISHHLPLNLDKYDKLSMFTKVIKYSFITNNYFLKRLEEAKLLPENYEILSEVIKGNVAIINKLDNSPSFTLYSVYRMALVLRYQSVANRKFIKLLISKFGVNHPVINFTGDFKLFLNACSKFDGGLNREDVEDIKFYISSGSPSDKLIDILINFTSTSSEYKAKERSEASEKLLMGFISYDYRATKYHDGYIENCEATSNILRFLIDHGLRDLSRLRLNDNNYPFLISCVFSFGPRAFYLNDSPSSKIVNEELIKGIDPERLRQACHYLTGVKNNLDDIFISVLSSLIMHYLFALNNGVKSNVNYLL